MTQAKCEWGILQIEIENGSKPKIPFANREKKIE